jgi:hypothetical protein
MGQFRDYASAIVAQTIVSENFEDAGSRAFRKLFKYIDGDNAAQGKIEMTSPVSQEKRSEKIAMASPVGQRAASGGWAFSFMMPDSHTLGTIPQPADPDIVIREVPAHRAVAIRLASHGSCAATKS